MPLFEFSCSYCGNQEEILILGKELPRCSKCGSADLKKLVSRFTGLTRSRNSGESAVISSPSILPEAAGHKCNASCNHGSVPSCSRDYLDAVVKKHERES